MRKNTVRFVYVSFNFILFYLFVFTFALEMNGPSYNQLSMRCHKDQEVAHHAETLSGRYNWLVNEKDPLILNT